MVVRHLYKKYDRYPNSKKVDDITKMKAYNSITEVRRFLEAYVFYQMEGLKVILKSRLILRQIDYDYSKSIVVIIDTSLIIICWIINQDDVKRRRFAIKFGTRIFTNKQRAYPQVKRELLKVLTTMKIDNNYLIRTNVNLKLIIFYY